MAAAPPGAVWLCARACEPLREAGSVKTIPANLRVRSAGTA